MDGLYSISNELLEAYDKLIQTKIAENPSDWKKGNMKFVHGDIFEYDWSNAGVVFANSTCFSHDMMDRLSEMPVKPGTLAINFTKPLGSKYWETLESTRKVMSWGDATVFISRRRVEPLEP